MGFSCSRLRQLLTNELEMVMQKELISGYGVRRIGECTVTEVHIYGDIGAARQLTYAISDIEVESINLTLDETASLIVMKLVEQVRRSS